MVIGRLHVPEVRIRCPEVFSRVMRHGKIFVHSMRKALVLPPLPEEDVDRVFLEKKVVIMFTFNK